MNIDTPIGHCDTPRIDALTGLASRVGLEEHLARLSASHRHGGPLSLLALELSRFGHVNDSMGAELGNRIITLVAKRLGKLFGHAATVARTHGNHFCLLFEGHDIDLDEQIELAQDFTQRPMALSGEVIVLSVRVGVAVLGDMVKTPSGLLHAAEVALHRAKREGIKCQFFQSDQTSEARTAQQLENDLRVSLFTHHAELHRAIANREFQVLYQPIVDTLTHQVHAVEALIRWHHPRRGLISPTDFIPMAEQIQVMDVLGSWVLRRACLDAMALPRNAEGARPGVSVNVSPIQFAEPGVLLSTVKQALTDSGLAPALLKLEITESLSLSATKFGVLDELRALGCQIAMDDFGTGYSSLTQLNAVPLDYVKLDQSFIHHIGGADAAEDQRSDRMTRLVLSLAKALDLTSIVEGIETEVQRDRLRQHGARLMQGYLFAKPLPLDEVCEFITRFNRIPQGEVHA
ncbi:MAG: bifunctional diguanylate cyclase/phosphodiesterase [Burkholderiaceae bacterium]|nr:MAG: bifunctional diguanylate cyclase/phosphodiesterase [Burkholderiaceae bacterium]